VAAESPGFGCAVEGKEFVEEGVKVREGEGAVFIGTG
jgi:hypothetical protein